MDELRQEPLDIINRGIEDYNPFKVFALFSGGNDSLVNAHVMSQHPRFSGVLHFDTGTGIRPNPELVALGMKSAKQHAIDTCARYGWPLWIYKTPERYGDLVKRWGFPGPAGHQLMYRRLKDRCVYMATKEHKEKRSQRIMLCTGLRQSESQRRMGYTNPVQRYRAQIWANPIFYWHKSDLDAYRELHNLPRNLLAESLVYIEGRDEPVEGLGMSGECGCGAHAKRGEKERIRRVSRVNYRYIRLLEALAHQHGHHWDWDEAPLRKKKDARADIAGAIDFQPLCASCNVRHELAMENKA